MFNPEGRGLSRKVAPETLEFGQENPQSTALKAGEFAVQQLMQIDRQLALVLISFFVLILREYGGRYPAKLTVAFVFLIFSKEEK